MRLYEYEAKRILREARVPIPQGEVVTDPQAAGEATEKLARPVIIKAQVLTTGRGKAGGIVAADSPGKAGEVARLLLGQRFKGRDVSAVLVEEKLSVAREFFCGITYDDAAKTAVFLVSAHGGIDLSQLAAQHQSLITRVEVNPFLGLQPYQSRYLSSALELPTEVRKEVQKIFTDLWDVFKVYDATLVEVNPLVLTKEGQVVAADAHIEVDDDALFRQRDRLKGLGIDEREDKPRNATPFELAAARIDREDYRGVAGRVIDFGGPLGLLIGAGGGSLTIFDAILRYGGKPANYCEVGGNPPVAKVHKLVKLILTKPGVAGIAVITNVLSNSRVDFLARGLVKALVELGIEPAEYPILFRSAGAFEEDGYAILRKYGISYLDRRISLDEAARRAVEMMEKGEIGYGDSG